MGKVLMRKVMGAGLSLEFSVQGLEFRVQGLELRVQDLEFRV